MLWAGFILLTTGPGALFRCCSRGGPTRDWPDDPKVIWSGLVWALYLALLVMHGRFHQSGRRFAWGARRHVSPLCC